MTSAPRLPLWRLLGTATAVWAATRLGLAIVTYFHVAAFATPPLPGCGTAASCFQPGYLGRWEHWDAGWFETIAVHGYRSPTETAFYPLYPLLIKAVSLVAGAAHVHAEAMLVANLCALAAFWGVALVAHVELGDRVPSYAVLGVASYPFAYYLAAAYSEALFLALAVFALFFARRGRWLPAAGLAAAAALTRPLGPALLLPLIWEWGRQAGVARGLAGFGLRQAGLGLLAALAVPAGLGVWLAYCWRRFGDPLAPLHSEALWGRHTTPPWSVLDLAVRALRSAPAHGYTQAIVAADVGCFALLLAITVIAARRLAAAFTLYSLGVLLIAIIGVQAAAGDPIASTGRLLLVAFPPLMFAGSLQGRAWWASVLWIGAGLLTQAGLLMLFLSWIWTG